MYNINKQICHPKLNKKFGSYINNIAINILKLILNIISYIMYTI